MTGLHKEGDINQCYEGLARDFTKETLRCKHDSSILGQCERHPPTHSINCLFLMTVVLIAAYVAQSVKFVFNDSGVDSCIHSTKREARASVRLKVPGCSLIAGLLKYHGTWS